MIALASSFACWLRYDGDIPPEVVNVYLATLPSLLVIRGFVFIPFGLYQGLWRYTGVWDLWRIVLAVFTSSLLAYAFIYEPVRAASYPRSIVIIDSILLVCYLGGVRLLWRIMPGAVRSNNGRRVLILGAGDAGEMIVREMRRGPGYQPIGFIDDDAAKVGRTIHGVPVLGTREDLARIITVSRPAELLVAIPSATPATVRSVVRELESFKLPITTLPTLQELVDGNVSLKHIRPLAIEDLLPRTQIALDGNGVRHLLQGTRVLVTGAGGSIGSELCRQIAAFGPACLVLFERYENSLYAVANDLADRGARTPIHSVVGDITDAARVDAVLATHRPQIVFHAAAHKHVPLMELNPCEAVKNNIVGTETIACAARHHGVERFVLISTDKAANPSSVMGASKRVAELIIQRLNAHGQTRFVAVRFGNVLGSNGSVIPRMLDQIRAGGPVTVTHPEIRRYFMLIPEAVQLVLRAAVLARDGETFVLNMGEQLKVLDVARNLIRLCGFVPEDEIPITFVGLRPGEKLVEELVGNGETLEPADIDKIFRVRRPQPASIDLQSEIAALVTAAVRGDAPEVIEHLQRIVPTFQPQPRTVAESAAAPTVPAQAIPQQPRLAVLHARAARALSIQSPMPAAAQMRES